MNRSHVGGLTPKVSEAVFIWKESWRVYCSEWLKKCSCALQNKPPAGSLGPAPHMAA
jgi:hypothetical protein